MVPGLLSLSLSLEPQSRSSNPSPSFHRPRSRGPRGGEVTGLEAKLALRLGSSLSVWSSHTRTAASQAGAMAEARPGSPRPEEESLQWLCDQLARCAEAPTWRHLSGGERPLIPKGLACGPLCESPLGWNGECMISAPVGKGSTRPCASQLWS